MNHFQGIKCHHLQILVTKLESVNVRSNPLFVQGNSHFAMQNKEDYILKATGIVRRIDDLGRLVIPKEIRRTLRIREGDPLEIFTDRDGEIILKKYSPIGELGIFARQYAESLAQTSGLTACIADRDQFIAVAGGGKSLLSKPISRKLEELVEARTSVLASKDDRAFIDISDDHTEEYLNEAICPIICEGDAIGAVILLGKEKD